MRSRRPLRFSKGAPVSQAELVKDLGKLAKITGRDVSAAVLVFFAEVIAEAVPVDAARSALRKWAVAQSRFPTPGDLIALVEGPKLQPKQIASETATRMLGMISRRGYTWTDTFRYDGHETFDDAVKADIGEEAIAVLNMCGGWQRFCQQFDEGVNGNARAQLRDLLETQLIRTHVAQHRANLGPASGQVAALVADIAKAKVIDVKPGLQVVERQAVRVDVPEVSDDELPF